MNYQTNSKLVKSGDIFVAIEGLHYDGHDFINEAIERGASAIVTNKKMCVNIKNIVVKDTTKYLNKKLKKINKKLTRNMTIVGITGTKGKTTTAQIIYQMLKNFKINVAYIGTLGFYYNDTVEVLDNTTPDIITLSRIFKTCSENNITHIIMEASAHGLTEKRIAGIHFSYALFTNFSQDHLDYYENMCNYLKAKLKILKYLRGLLIVNDDDKNSQNFKKKHNNYVSIGENGTYKLNNYNLYQTSSLINMEYNYNNYSISIPYTGKYNIYNYLIAFATVCELGFDIHDIINITNNLAPIKGRNELIKTKNGFVVIDYAHSPNSVEEVLNSYKNIAKEKIITIIGCGGNRDKSKRPIMAEISTNLSDYVIFTNDNPRDEDEKSIMNDMVKNLCKTNYEIIYDRKDAIKKGVKLLHKNDYLVILGKGHEDYQIIKNTKYHFDDKEEVLKIIN